MKVFMLAVACLAAVISAEPEAHYGGYGYGHQLSWPGVYGPGFSSTCYGCRPYHHLGKREAEAEPHYGYGGYGGGYGATGFVGRTIWGHPGHGYGYGHYLGKRSAEPHYGYGGYYGYGPFLGHPRAVIPTAAGPTGVAGHPTGTSYVAHGVPLGIRGKRSAEPHGFYGPYLYHGFGPAGVAGHPTGTSYVANSPWGLGK